MVNHIKISLYATIKPLTPSDADSYPVQAGETVRNLLDRLGVPMDMAKLVFVDGRKANWDQVLDGAKKIGVFPPVGGG